MHKKNEKLNARNNDKLLQRDWTPVKNKILCSELSPTVFKVYVGISAYAFGGKDFSFPTLQTLSGRLHMDKSQISRAIKKLSEAGLVQVGIYKNRRGQPCRYTPLEPPENFNPNYTSLRGKRTKEDTKIKSPKSRYVYLITDRDCVKIGITENVERRLKSLQTANPRELQLIAKYEVEYPTKIEKIIHEHYQNKRTKSEWFELTKHDIDVVKKYLSFHSV